MADSLLRRTATALGAKQIIMRASSEKTYLKVRGAGLRAQARILNTRDFVRQRIENRNVPHDHKVVKRSGYYWRLRSGLHPDTVRNENLSWVTSCLSDANITWWLVRDEIGHRRVIGAERTEAPSILRALAADSSKHPGYILPVDSSIDVGYPVGKAADRNRLYESSIWRLARPVHLPGSDLYYGMESGCDIELWDVQRDVVTAPRENRAAKVLSSDSFELKQVESKGVKAWMPKALTHRMLDDIVFPIDAVYTWVDGSDEDWLAQKRYYDHFDDHNVYHPEANHDTRFRSRDELRYSLRSLESYAPWFNRIYLVTNGQIPDWLDTSNEKIKVVTHDDLYDDLSVLPTFNSNSIISRLHHISGLSEHYVYINDDVFFGKTVDPAHFFYANGVARVSISNNRRPFGDPTVDDEPHFNLTRNMREALERDFGITISRAIKHTPHPQIRSVHFELEERYSKEYASTWASRFRHHSDLVADQLHHYYAQITGRAVPGWLRYRYINIGDDAYKTALADTLRLRNRHTFCLNDAHVPGAKPIPDYEISDFLERYFPVASSFEKI